MLQYAASELSMDKLTDGERDALKIFNERLSKLEELQEKRAEGLLRCMLSTADTLRKMQTPR